MSMQSAAARSTTSRRASGIAWLLAVAYLALPAMRAVLVLLDSRTLPDAPSAADIPALEPQGVIGLVSFLGLAAGFLALVCTTADAGASAARASLPSRWMRFGTSAGVIGAAGLALVAVQARIQFSWMSANLALATDDPSAQAAALWTLNLASATGLAVFALGLAAWTTCLALDGSLVSRGWGTAAAAAACLFAVAAAGLVLPAGQYLCVPLFVCLALALRRAGRNTALASEPASDARRRSAESLPRAVATPRSTAQLGESTAP